ncbi:MAG: S8 family peptidase [Bacteroidales bacterium]|nr:S8 family peptidase [Bacteroidales bacterium]
MRYLKCLFLLAVSIVIVGSAVCQNIYPDYKDGKLYLVLEKSHIQNTDIPLNFLENNDIGIHIKSVSQPFAIDSDTLSRTWQISFKPAEKVDEFMQYFSNQPEVEFAERIPLTRVFLTPNDPLYSSTSYGYDWNWHLDNIRAEEAWDLSTGSSNVKIAIVDNAVYTNHVDLQNKFILEKDLSDNDNNANPPAGGTSYDKYVWSHGTHCAGLVAAETNNGIGVAGIGYNVSLIGVKTAPDTSSGEYTYNGIAGVQWAAQKGADIISASWGGTGYSAVNNNFYSTLKNNGVMVVAAAGNEGDGSNPKNYPAAYNAVIAVGSTNADDKRSSFSQYGDWLDISAPGGFYPDENSSYKISVLSTTYNNAYLAQGAITGKYDISQGTSMSTPIVAGVLGLMKSGFPSASFQTLKNCLIWGCDNIDGLNQPAYTGKMGAGRINALNSIQCILGTGTDTIEEEEVNVFPNPSYGEMLIRNLDSQEFTLMVFDISGKKILSRQLSDNFINLKALDAGLYFLHIATHNKKHVKRIIIQPDN